MHLYNSDSGAIGMNTSNGKVFCPNSDAVTSLQRDIIVCAVLSGYSKLRRITRDWAQSIVNELVLSIENCNYCPLTTNRPNLNRLAEVMEKR